MSPRPSTLGLAALSFVLLAATALGGYTGGGTFVVKTDETGTLLDDGGVICEGTDGDGVGGGCLLFPAPGADGSAEPRVFIQVRDDTVGPRVAFQVCIDNNGDGICGGPQTNPRCFDQIFFSHADGGKFFNPLGPLPTTFLPGCPGGFPGYVVLLCQGVHDDREQGPHQHRVTTGTIGFAIEGSGYGDFCGGGGQGGSTGNSPAVAKAYRVV